MTCGLKLDALKAAARTVVKERDILGREEKAPPFGADSLLDRVRAAVATLRGLKAKCVNRDDDAYRSVLDLESDLARAERLDPASREQLLPRDARRLQPGPAGELEADGRLQGRRRTS